MREIKWIGEKVDTSGNYVDTSCERLIKRSGGRAGAVELYLFKDEFGGEYYITDEKVISNIKNSLECESDLQRVQLEFYLYELVVQRFGIAEFLERVERRIEDEKDLSYKMGRSDVQKEVRASLGIKESW